MSVAMKQSAQAAACSSSGRSAVRPPVASSRLSSSSSRVFAPATRNSRLVLARSHKVQIEHDGKTFDLEVPEGQTILEVALDKGLDLPHDCKLGVCMTCPAKLVRGTQHWEGAWLVWLGFVCCGAVAAPFNKKGEGASWGARNPLGGQEAECRGGCCCSARGALAWSIFRCCCGCLCQLQQAATMIACVPTRRAGRREGGFGLGEQALACSPYKSHTPCWLLLPPSKLLLLAPAAPAGSCCCCFCLCRCKARLTSLARC